MQLIELDVKVVIRCKSGNKNIVIFTQRSAIVGYLLDKLDIGYNLDDRLVLSYNEKVILDDKGSNVDIVKVEFEKGKVINCEVIDCEI